MNRLCALFMVAFFLLTSFSGNSQTVIPSYSLSITFQKTTNIIFPYRIEKADIGSGDVIGHKDLVLPNVLFLKANRKGFEPTNLSVYTSDGKFYSFLVRYIDEPDTLNLSFVNDKKSGPILFDTVNDARLDSDAATIQDARSIMHRKTSLQQMKLLLRGIYIKDNLMWFKLEIRNHSDVAFQPEYIRFSVQDKRAGKRTAVQENEKIPAWQLPYVPIFGQSGKTIVYGFPAFTMDKYKRLLIEISEKNGGRQLHLPVSAKTLLQCQSL